MNVTSLLNYYRSQQYTPTSSVSGVSASVEKAFAKATARVDGQIASTNVQVSAYGQVKSGVAQVQDAAKSLASGKTTAVADLKKGVQALVDAYNSTRTTAATASGNAAATASESLRQTATTDTAKADWQSLGVTVNRDGSLSLDSKALEAAYQSSASSVQSAAKSVGGAFSTTANSVLSSNGSLNTTIDALNAKVQSLEARKTDQQNAAKAAMDQIGQQASNFNSAFSGIQSYRNIFSL